MRSISTKNTANKKIIFIYFSYKNFTLENFINKIIEILELNTTYSILIKLSYNNNQAFKMCGHQIGLTVQDIMEIQHFRDLYDVILMRIDQTFENYIMIDNINTIEVSLFKIDSLPELKIKNINNLNLPKFIINSHLNRYYYNNKILPFTTDMRYYGQKVIDNNLCKTYLNKIKEVNKNILDLLNPLNENDIFYIYSYKYGNLTKNDNKKEILIINKPSPVRVTLKIYKIRIVLLNILDTFLI